MSRALAVLIQLIDDEKDVWSCGRGEKWSNVGIRFGQMSNGCKLSLEMEVGEVRG